MTNFLDRSIYWIGPIDNDSVKEVLGKIIDYQEKDSKKFINLIITSYGGDSSLALDFYDTNRYLIKPKIQTIAAGATYSAAIIVFLAGIKRLVSPHTTFYFHEIDYPELSHVKASQMEALIKSAETESRYYAEIVSQRSGYKLSIKTIREMMRKEASLTAKEAVKLGIAHKIIDKDTFKN